MTIVEKVLLAIFLVCLHGYTIAKLAPYPAEETNGMLVLLVFSGAIFLLYNPPEGDSK